MASPSLYPEFETNLMSNCKVIELLLQLKSAKAHGKNYIKPDLPWSAILRNYLLSQQSINSPSDKHKIVTLKGSFLH